MSRRRRVALLLGLAALACGEAPFDDQQTDGWVDSSVPPTSLLDDGDNDDEPYAVWVGYAQLSSEGTKLVGDGGFFADGPNREPCFLWFEIESSTALDDCPGCDFAFELVYGEAAVENSAGCPDFGVDPDHIKGMTQTIGYSGDETALVRVNGTWVEGGDAHLDDDGWFEFELDH